MIDFNGIFRDPSWRPYWPEITKPHRLYVKHHDNGKVAVVVSRQTRSGGHWSISKAALDYVVKAAHEGRIAEGYVLLADNTWTVIAHARAHEVVANIGNTPPNPGQWGSDFWWLDATLKPAARGTVNDATPF